MDKKGSSLMLVFSLSGSIIMLVDFIVIFYTIYTRSDSTYYSEKLSYAVGEEGN